MGVMERTQPLRERFAEQLRALPARPGVYVFRDDQGDVIYVGKAASLRNRVRNYFGSPRSLEPKTRRLLERVGSLDWILTGSESEALMLEATLVKRHQPLFNVRLRDDKHYPYLKIDVNAPWPRVTITRRIEDDGARYFGPYASAHSVRTALDLVKRLFPWRSCTKEITGHDPRPCLDYYIHRCIAPCSGYCTEEEYREVIRQVVLFLEGHTEEVMRILEGRMRVAAETYDYERAALFRDQIHALQHVAERQQFATTRPAEMDVFGMARADDEACVHVFFVRGTNVIGRDSFILQGTRDETDAAVLSGFLRQLYGGGAMVPAEVLLPASTDDASAIRAWMVERRHGAVRLWVPQRGDGLRLVKLANENAKEALEIERIRWLADRERTAEALEQLRDELGLPDIPRRIECYDISNIQGRDSVASMVVFVDGRPARSEYRRFRIKTVEGADDFASMAEVLRRRFRRFQQAAEAGPDGADEGPLVAGWGALPDLVIVDGGRGQLNAALDVLRNLGLGQVPVSGLAKEREELHVVDLDEPVVLPRASQALYLVQRVRDEAHRFAITYHRAVRQKHGFESQLDRVQGIGPKRRRALLRKFGSLRAIREASVDEIAATVGMTRSLAERVKQAI